MEENGKKSISGKPQTNGGTVSLFFCLNYDFCD